MDKQMKATYAVRAELGGRKAMFSLNLIAQPGDNIFLHGSNIKRRQHFEVLCGLRKPDVGEVSMCGQQIYSLSTSQIAAFRRDTIGGIPEGGGLIPELPMIDQIVLPMVLAGESTEIIRTRLKEMTDGQIPGHSLYNLPGKVPVRKAAFAALLRTMIRNPKIIVINGFFDELEELDTDALWQALEKLRTPESTLLFLSSDPAPEQIRWTQTIKL